MALYVRQSAGRQDGGQDSRGAAGQSGLGLVAGGGGFALWRGLPPLRRGEHSGSRGGLLPRAPQPVVRGTLLSVTRRTVAILYRHHRAPACRRTAAANPKTGEQRRAGEQRG